MSEALKLVYAAVVVAFVFAPWFIGLSDFVCWFFTDSQCTPLQWTNARLIVAAFWPIVIGFSVVAVMEWLNL